MNDEATPDLDPVEVLTSATQAATQARQAIKDKIEFHKSELARLRASVRGGPRKPRAKKDGAARKTGGNKKTT